MAELYPILRALKMGGNAGGGGGGGAVSGVKGNEESTYRTGEVNLTPANILNAAQQAAVNSGITSEKLGTVENDILTIQGKTTGMSEGGSDYITVNGIRVYVSSTVPTGARTGDLWIGG